MTAARWRRLRELFHEALERDAASRQALLQGLSASDSDLCTELSALLAAHEAGDSFLEPAEPHDASGGASGIDAEFPGTLVAGRYRIVRLLGRGGSSAVFLAEDERVGRRRVVVKVLDQSSGDAAWFQKRFRREVEILGTIDHPGIVAAHDCGELPGGRPFLVMDFVDGITLRERMRTPIGVPEAAEIARQLGAALAAAHRMRIFHRDLKPENVMLQTGTEPGSWSVKLIDFGIAKVDQPAGTATTGLFIAGTAQYMAPEQFHGLATAATDIYALAAICCEMLTRRTPFGQDGKAELENLPKPVRPAIRKALAFDHRRRPQDASEFTAAFAAALTAGRRPPRRALAALTASFAVLALAILLWHPAAVVHSSLPPRLSSAVRLTAPDELALDPAISPDGKWIAYASDRDSPGRTDIWIRETATGKARRITSDPEGADQPAFSADAATVAYHSRSGGIYTVPAAGGTPAKLADSGQRPRYSPDGAYIAYQKGDLESGYSEISVASTGGGGERNMNRNCGGEAAGPAWSPDARYVLFWCKAFSGARGVGDFWVVPLVDGPAVPTGAARILAAQGLRPSLETQNSFTPEAWVGGHVLFAARRGSRRGLWSIRIPESTAVAEGPAEFLETAGASGAYAASASASKAARPTLVFSTLVSNPDLWRLPLRSDGLPIPAALERLTSSPATDRRVSLSADGKGLSFVSDRTGESSVWFMDLRTGSERQLTRGMEVKLTPRLSPDGSQVAFTTEHNRERTVRLTGTAAGSTPREICTACGYPRAWWPDGRQLLLDPLYDLDTQTAFAISLRDIDTGREDRIPTHLYCIDPKISPDGAWAVAGAYATGPPVTERILAVPLKKNSRGVPVVPSADQWIPISDRTAFNAMPVWGPGGTVVYFVSNADGHACIWARRVDPRTKRPIGPSFAVYHSHDARLSLDNLGLSVGIDPAAAPGELIFAQAGRTGSIWMASLQ